MYNFYVFTTSTFKIQVKCVARLSHVFRCGFDNIRWHIFFKGDSPSRPRYGDLVINQLRKNQKFWKSISEQLYTKTEKVSYKSCLTTLECTKIHARTILILIYINPATIPTTLKPYNRSIISTRHIKKVVHLCIKHFLKILLLCIGRSWNSWSNGVAFNFFQSTNPTNHFQI